MYRMNFIGPGFFSQKFIGDSQFPWAKISQFVHGEDSCSENQMNLVGPVLTAPSAALRPLDPLLSDHFQVECQW